MHFSFLAATLLFVTCPGGKTRQNRLLTDMCSKAAIQRIRKLNASIEISVPFYFHFQMTKEDMDELTKSGVDCASDVVNNGEINEHIHNYVLVFRTLLQSCMEGLRYFRDDYPSLKELRSDGSKLLLGECLLKARRRCHRVYPLHIKRVRSITPLPELREII